jgi:hypothetical protein
MTTFQNLIDETRGHLMTEKADRVNVLGANSLVNTTTLVLANNVVGLAAGSQLSVGLEVFLVAEDPPSDLPGTTVAVIPGWAGSTPAAHSLGDIVYVNPQFSNYRIAQQLNHCIVALDSHGLFRIRNLLVPFEAARSGYDFAATDFIDVWRVSYDTPGPDHTWPVLGTRDYYVDISADTTDFPSGKQFVLRQGGSPGRNIKVSYKASYSPLVNAADDVEVTSGLHRSAHEIPPLGAAMRILTGAEVKRTFLTSQPEPRRQEEVPPGSMRQSMIPIATAYYEAIDREILYLHRLYPMQF